MIAYEFHARWQLPTKLPCFTGRIAELEELTRLFTENRKQRTIISHKHNSKITGSGGIGKTQLSIEFAHRSLESKLFTNVLWLNADCSQNDSLLEEFANLARAFGKYNQDDTRVIIVAKVYTELIDRGETLIIFDNASSLHALKPYLPHRTIPVSVLISTRDSSKWDCELSEISLDVFTVTETILYLSKTVKSSLYDDYQAEQLANMLGCYPLALAQAVAYINTVNISIKTYLSMFLCEKEEQKELLDSSLLPSDFHQQTLWVTIALCITKLNSPSAIELLHFCQFIAPEKTIKAAILHQLAGIDNDVNASQSLTAYGIFTRIPGSTKVKIHCMVQEIITLQLTNKKNIDHYVLPIIMTMANLALRNRKSLRNSRYLIPHLVCIRSYISTRTITLRLVFHLCTGTIENILGELYSEDHNFLNAEHQLESAHQALQIAMPSSTITKLCQLKLTSLKWMAQRENTEEYIDNIDSQHFSSGDDVSSRLVTLSQLAMKVQFHSVGCGEPTQTQQYIHEGLKLIKTTQSEHSLWLETVIGFIRMSADYSSFHNNFAKGTELLTYAIQLVEAHFDPNSNTAVATHLCMGNQMQTMQKFDQALEYFSKAKSAILTLNGKLSYEMGMYYLSAAVALCYFENYSEIIENLTKIMPIFERAHHGIHNTVVMGYFRIGFAYEGQGNYSEAINAYNKALDVCLQCPKSTLNEINKQLIVDSINRVRPQEQQQKKAPLSSPHL